MKKFILRAILFCLLALIVTGVISGTVALLLKRKINNSTVFTLPNSKQYLFLGDSHIECGINDTLFSEALNLGTPSEAYLYTYARTQYLLTYNRQIKAVIIGFSPHNFSTYTDPWLEGDYYLPYRIPRFFYSIPEEEQQRLFQLNPAAYIKGYIRVILSSYFIFKDDFSNLKSLKWGGFNPFDRSALVFQLQRPLQSFHRPGKLVNIQIKYILKLDSLCKAKNTQLILLGTPLHSGRIARIPQDTTQFYNLYRAHFSHIPFYNYTTFPLPDSCYGDTKHLNLQGSLVFSDVLRKRLLREYPPDFQAK